MAATRARTARRSSACGWATPRRAWSSTAGRTRCPPWPPASATRSRRGRSTGRVADRNGPWLSERLRELGVDHAYTLVVGDRRADLEEALRFMASQGVDLVVTSGGLGPTADDLTAEVVGAFAGRPMVLDAALEERIAGI